jgi:hypothetical protein
MTSGMWCSWIEINEKKAKELGIAQGDLIEVTSTQGSLRRRRFCRLASRRMRLPFRSDRDTPTSRATPPIAA